MLYNAKGNWQDGGLNHKTNPLCLPGILYVTGWGILYAATQSSDGLIEEGAEKMKRRCRWSCGCLNRMHSSILIAFTP